MARVQEEQASGNEVTEDYDDARNAMGVGYLVLKARTTAGLTQNVSTRPSLVTSQ